MLYIKDGIDVDLLFIVRRPDLGLRWSYRM